MKALYLAIFAALAMCGSACAQNVPPAEQRYIPYSGNLPPCDVPWALQTVTDRFRQIRSEFWHSDLQILFYDRVREIGFRSNGLSYIPRRYCAARAFLNDCDPRVNDRCKGRMVIYAIGEKTNMIGWNDGVQWCVVGLDPSLAYAPNFRASNREAAWRDWAEISCGTTRFMSAAAATSASICTAARATPAPICTMARNIRDASANPI